MVNKGNARIVRKIQINLEEKKIIWSPKILSEEIKKEKMSKNVFLDLGSSDEEAAGLKLRSYLFIALQEIIRKSKMTQGEIAELIDADQPKVSKILNGKFNEFSIERVAEYLQKLGYDIHIGAVPCPPQRHHGTVILDKPKLAKV